MTTTTRLALTTVNLDTPDPAALSRFYACLLGWTVEVEEADDVILRAPEGGVGLSFQRERAYVRPTWPAEADRQQMMMHLEIGVEDLAAALDHALACGATLAEFQPQDDVRVCLDPDGHPFCLWLMD
ncbi:VOC family protein [Micromonospora craniellae]|uniref:VOC family protein n=1 Tax=Micromonospora craniellae TaxID=2294034 RepID=A0A372G0Z5_9ACTN|nr:VOC family protein [Micromonospora craniellae]QOC91900.1 VOC family protein [Micromonospora craniellae]RFS46731.1 VOC family protein [Micromonospora craniellae]